MKKIFINEKEFTYNKISELPLKEFNIVVGKKTTFGNKCFLQNSVSIANNCQIGSFVKLDKHVIIKNNCKIGNYTTIGKFSTILKDCIIEKGSHIANSVFIEENNLIGTYCKIQDYVIVEKESKIESHTMIHSGCRIVSGSIVSKAIYIQLSNLLYSVYQYADMIQIGCKVYPIDFWVKNYKNIGKKQKAPEEVIKKYGKVILFLKNFSKK